MFVITKNIIMKLSTLTFLALFILLTAFTCENEPLEGDFVVEESNDGNTNNSNNVALEGTWLLTAWNSDNPVDINNDGTASTNLLAEFNCYNNETLVFTSNGMGSANSTSYADFSFEIEVGTTDSYIYSVDCIQETEISPFTWIQSGNNVAISVTGGGTTNWTLTNNQLSILIPEGFMAFSEDFTTTVTEDLTFVYTKQ